MRRVLCRDGASPRISGMFYKAVVQSVLLYGSESCVLTDSLIHKLEAFHHGVARRITGTKASFCRVTSVWSAPPIEEQASLFPIREYLKRRQMKTIEYVATRPIYHEATTTARRLGSSTRRKFWGITLQRDDQLGS